MRVGYFLLAAAVLIVGVGLGQAEGEQRMDWSVRVGQVSPADGVIGSGTSLGLGVEWGDAGGGFLATVDLSSLDSRTHGLGEFAQTILGLAYTSRPVLHQRAVRSPAQRLWWGGGLALIDEIDQVVGYTVFAGYDLSEQLILEARHSRASRWGFDYGGTNISLGWRFPMRERMP